MKVKEIRLIRDKLGIQLQVEELREIIKIIEKKKPCNFLIFGVGKDSALWIKLNKKGRTVFVEDLKRWNDMIKKKNPKIESYLIKYFTKRENWKKLMKNPKKLILNFPKKIQNEKWDVILVDGPRGWKDGQPGRMQSIYTASKLIKKKGHVFVHDCWREIEATYSNKFLMKKNLVKEIKSLRHYQIK